MAKEGSVAPKERVNITYKPSTGDAQEEVELPFKMLMLSDFTGRTDPRPVEERAPISVDKDNFAQVMAEQQLSVQTSVPDKLSEQPGAELSVKLSLRSLADFTPDGIAAQVPELQQLLALRRQIDSLKFGTSASAGTSLRSQLNAKKATLAEARQRYGEEYPDVKKLQRDIATLEARIKAGERADVEMTDGTAVGMQLRTQINAIDSQLASIAAQNASLRAKLTGLEKNVTSAPQVEREYATATRDLTIARELLAFGIFPAPLSAWYASKATRRSGLLLGVATSPAKELARSCDRLVDVVRRFS